MKLRKSLFWDTSLENIDTDKNAKYIIERVLDFGRDGEIKSLWKKYDRSVIRDTVMNSRSLRPKAKKLWTLILQK